MDRRCSEYEKKQCFRKCYNDYLIGWSNLDTFDKKDLREYCVKKCYKQKFTH
jgi:hypothetical protein